MIIPGANLLNMAFSLIAQQSVLHYRFLERITNEAGIDEPVYAEPDTITGSLQPVPRIMYQAYGLDYVKNYVMFYTSVNVLDVGRDVSGDKIEFQGKVFQCLSANDWHGVDGWLAILAVEIEQTADALFYDFYGFGEYRANYNNAPFGA